MDVFLVSLDLTYNRYTGFYMMATLVFDELKVISQALFYKKLNV